LQRSRRLHDLRRGHTSIIAARPDFDDGSAGPAALSRRSGPRSRARHAPLDVRAFCRFVS